MNINDLETKYELEIKNIIKNIKKLKTKNKKNLVLLQFPDGLKPYSVKISKLIEEKANCICLIWHGTCFGSCDVPLLGQAEKDIDLIIQFGHSSFGF